MRHKGEHVYLDQLVCVLLRIGLKLGKVNHHHMSHTSISVMGHNFMLAHSNACKVVLVVGLCYASMCVTVSFVYVRVTVSCSRANFMYLMLP